MKGSDGRKPTTLKEVAQRARVSIASVSRVLNNIEPISDELRSQVETAVHELGYRPRRSSNAAESPVVVLIGDLHNTYYAEIVSGVQSVADARGIPLTIALDQGGPDHKARFLRWLSRLSVSGLIVCSSGARYDRELMRVHTLSDIAIVSINPPEVVPGIPAIRIDYERAIAKAVQHALRFGHKRIAMLNSNDTAYSSVSKRAGVVAALDRAGLPLAGELYVERVPNVEGGFQATNWLLNLPEERRPTAIIASNDLMALGAMHAIRSAGLSLPQDMTVIGFDDVEMAAHANPPLTTIAPPKFEMGRRAMEALLESREGRTAPPDSYVVMESPLIVRESSGPV